MNTCATLLLSQVQIFDHPLIPFGIFPVQIVQESAPLSDEFHETPPGMMILGVRPKMFGQILDSLGEQRNLHFRRSAVGFVDPELFNECALHFPG